MGKDLRYDAYADDDDYVSLKELRQIRKVAKTVRRTNSQREERMDGRDDWS